MTPDTDAVESSEIILDFSALDRLPTDKDLPSDDGEPLETAWHRPAMTLLIESISCHWHDRSDFYVGGNMFMYFSEERVFHKDFRGPDFFVVKDVDRRKPRDSWVAWKEGGRLPDVIVELGSESTRKTDRVEKRTLYGSRMKVAEYFIYDPRDDSLIGWRLTNGGYDEPLEVEPGPRVWSNQIELYLGPWDGVYLGERNRWLRFFDVHGKLIPTFAEAARAEASAAAARATESAARADSEAARANAAVAARLAAEQRTATETAALAAAEAELERLRQELEALRKQQPPTTP